MSIEIPDIRVHIEKNKKRRYASMDTCVPTRSTQLYLLAKYAPALREDYTKREANYIKY